MKEIISLFEKKKNLIIYKWYNYKPENKITVESFILKSIA